MVSKVIPTICFGFLVLHVLAQKPIKRAAAEAPAKPKEPEVTIVKQEQELNPDGSYSSSYETSNGIVYSEKAEVINPGEKDQTQVITGSLKYTAPDGQAISLTWTSDNNGTVFQGDHLPTPPPTEPVPDAIKKALEWAAEHPYKEEDEKATAN